MRAQFFSTGSKKTSPQIPPQTMRGYSHGALSSGAIFTPNNAVISVAPKSQTARLGSERSSLMVEYTWADFIGYVMCAVWAFVILAGIAGVLVLMDKIQAKKKGKKQ